MVTKVLLFGRSYNFSIATLLGAIEKIGGVKQKEYL